MKRPVRKSYMKSPGAVKHNDLTDPKKRLFKRSRRVRDIHQSGTDTGFIIYIFMIIKGSDVEVFTGKWSRGLKL